MHGTSTKLLVLHVLYAIYYTHKINALGRVQFWNFHFLYETTWECGGKGFLGFMIFLPTKWDEDTRSWRRDCYFMVVKNQILELVMLVFFVIMHFILSFFYFLEDFAISCFYITSWWEIKLSCGVCVLGTDITFCSVESKRFFLYFCQGVVFQFVVCVAKY